MKGFERFARTIFFLFLPMSIATASYWLSTVGTQEVDDPWDFIDDGAAAVIVTSILALVSLAAALRLTGFLALSFWDHLMRLLRTWRRRGPQRRNAPPLVSIVLPAFNEGPCIEDALESLLNLDYPNLEIIVVDDGSRDCTLDRALRFRAAHVDSRVTVYWKTNGGKSSALNYGIERSSGEFIVAVDGDSVLDSATLALALTHFEDSSVGAVAGYVKVANASGLLSRLQFVEYVVGLNLVRRGQGALGAVGTVPGPIGVFRRTALREVGGFESDTYAEDFDLTQRMLLQGWKVRFEPLAVSHTEAPETIISLVRQRYRWTRGILQVLRKHRLYFFVGSGHWLASGILWLTFLEAVLWPFASCIGFFALVGALLNPETQSIAVMFWVQLLLLEALVNIYCLGIDESRVRYAIYTPIVRSVFHVLLDVTKVLASFEELIRLHMSWGSIERRGRIGAVAK